MVFYLLRKATVTTDQGTINENIRFYPILVTVVKGGREYLLRISENAGESLLADVSTIQITDHELKTTLTPPKLIQAHLVDLFTSEPACENERKNSVGQPAQEILSWLEGLA